MSIKKTIEEKAMELFPLVSKGENIASSDEFTTNEIKHIERIAFRKGAEFSMQWIDAKENKPDKLTSNLSNYCACKCVTQGFNHNRSNYYICIFNFDKNEWISVETGKIYHVTHFIEL